MTAEKENVAPYLRREHVGVPESWTLRKSTQYFPAGRERISAAVLCYTHTFKNITYYYYYYVQPGKSCLSTFIFWPEYRVTYRSICTTGSPYRTRVLSAPSM